MNDDFESRVRDLKARAHGHWTPLLGALGVDERILNGKNQPCPLCGGTDRFQYTDKFGEGKSKPELASGSLPSNGRRFGTPGAMRPSSCGTSCSGWSRRMCDTIDNVR